VFQNCSLKKSVCLLLFLFLFFNLRAQVNRTDSIRKIKKRDSLNQQEDIKSVLYKAFKINKSPKKDSAKLEPNALHPSILPAVAYTLSNGVAFDVGISLSKRLGNPDSTRSSVLSSNSFYSLRQQYELPLIGSIWLDQNKFNILSDARYYRFPSYTYGLGGSSSLSDYEFIDFSYVSIHEEVLKYLAPNFYGGGGYFMDYHDIINAVSSKTDFDTYNDGPRTSTSSGIVGQLKYDDRENLNYPIDASYASVTYRYNSTLLGSNNNWQSLLLEFRKYIRLSPHSNNVLAFWSWNTITFGGKPPYFDLPSTGWDISSNMGRGYIQGRFRGTSYYYLEGEYRFGLTKNGLLGGVVFSNLSAVPEWPSNKIQTIDPGDGVGIRIKTNRYSNTNLDVDYGFGIGGSKGLFFNLGEAF